MTEELPVGRAEVVEPHFGHRGAGHGRRLLDAVVRGRPAYRSVERENHGCC